MVICMCGYPLGCAVVICKECVFYFILFFVINLWDRLLFFGSFWCCYVYVLPMLTSTEIPWNWVWHKRSQCQLFEV